VKIKLQKPRNGCRKSDCEGKKIGRFGGKIIKHHIEIAEPSLYRRREANVYFKVFLWYILG